MAMSKMKKEMLEDIGQHLMNQLRRLIIDTADICDVAELDRPVVARMLMSVLLCELIQGAEALEMNEREFLQGCKKGRELWIEESGRAIWEEMEEEEQRRKAH